MDALRLSLLIIGVILVAGIYIWSRRTSTKDFSLKSLNPKSFNPKSLNPGPFLSSVYNRILSARRQPPVLNDVIVDKDDEEWDPVPGMIAEPEIGDVEELDLEVRALDPSDQGAEHASGEELVIVLRIMAPQDRPFAGPEIARAMQLAGLEFGEMSIYHFYADADDVSSRQDRQAVCSVANAVEPGVFEPEKMEQLATPGLTLFMQLPGPLECRVAFEKMLEIGRSLAEELDGELCDDSRSVLTMQTISHIKEKIEAYLFKVRMAGVKERPT